MKQKDDVVYIHGVRPEWKYFGLLSLGNSKSLSINLALQKDQAIALLLKKQNHVGSLVNDETSKISLVNTYTFGGLYNPLG
jgi:hypothetical protein